MSKATYTNHDGSKVELDVITRHKNGTADLGREGVVLVEKCFIADEEQRGCAVIAEKKSAKSKADKKPDADAVAAASAALVDLEKAFAADPTNEQLGKQVDEAREALAALQ